VTTSVAVFETAICVKSVYTIKIMIENKKREYGNQRNLYKNFHLKMV